MGSSETINCALQALPRASGPKLWVKVANLPSWIAAALPITMPARITPCPPKPAMRIS